MIKKLIVLYKLLSPVHLLKKPFANDSNSLDTKFYAELLHIIGLEEVKEGSKKLIRRKAKPDHASLLENTMQKLKDRESLRNIQGLTAYGTTGEEQLYNVALELCITWVNRVLFLKLLEAQLLKYHKGNREYTFLNTEGIFDFDELSNLFFGVLAERPALRREELKAKFAKVPYLNSSLFERTALERTTIDISSLDNRLQLPLHATTVLKGETDTKRLTGQLATLPYLFRFLEAYDFTSEGGEEIQEENKNLINASVLGLIFEKINGYKDGSFFTPGFVTMYMCRETIRRAVVQKFNEAKGWTCKSFDELFDKIEGKKEANTIINSLTICDPAVGSGHFLVSALNELIAIKSELKILLDRQGKTLRDYEIVVENDELIVIDDNGDPFEYNFHNKESQRVQEALFHEKETLIERCLFGVDINPNSVKICRLRLWIELLKHAYYTTASNYTELETLPNIDINIKTGNSLISRFALDADITKALSNSKWNIESYKLAVQAYRDAQTKEEKREMEDLIETIKKDFRSEISVNDKKVKDLSKKRGELFNLTGTKELFDTGAKKKGDNKKQVEKLSKEIDSLEKDIEEIKNNRIYENAFEWRFEFPEVLDGEGKFVGFDVVIGNPPYFSLSKIKEYAKYFETAGYLTYLKGSDIYCLFYERGCQILKSKGLLNFITSNSWLRAIYGEPLKKFFKEEQMPIILLNIEDVQIFDEATVESNIIVLQKNNQAFTFPVCSLNSDYIIGTPLHEYVKEHHFNITVSDSSDWIISNESSDKLKQKVEQGSKFLKEFNVNINFGLKTGLNNAFIIDEAVKQKLILEDIKNLEILKPILRGRDLKKYSFSFSNFYLINTHNGIKKKGIMRINAQIDYPSIYKHLSSFKPSIEIRSDMGDDWTNLRNCAYLEDFDKPKIIWGEISDKPKFAYDDEGHYAEATTFLMTGEKLKFLLGVLNSKVSEWYFNQISTTTGMGTNRWKKYKIENLPIKIVTPEQENSLVDLVDKILLLKKESPQADTSSLEKEVDLMVYKLYDLTYEEVKIIDESVSEEEYTNTILQ